MKRIPQSGCSQYWKILEHSGMMRGFAESDGMQMLRELDVHVCRYGREELVLLEGELVEDIAVLCSGTVRGEKFHTGGTVDLMYIYRPGETFGAEAAVSRLRSSPLTYIANEGADIAFFSLERIRKSRYAAEITQALLQILADDSIRKLYKIEILSKRGLRDRITTYLKIMHQKAGKKTFSIHMDQVQFAQYLCVNRSALSWELNRMKKEGLIDFKKDRFEISEKML